MKPPLFTRYYCGLVGCFVSALIMFAAPLHAQETKPQSDRTPAPVMSFRGAPWLERSSRDQEEQPYRVLEAMQLKPGDVVADIGCGTGYYARKMARLVAPEGKVYGVDIQPEMLDMMMEFCDKEKIGNVIPVLGDTADPHLPPERIDWMILADVYHEFQAPEIMLARMRDSLKPDGKIALLEYRLKGTTAAHIKTEHRMSVEQVMSEWLPAGFELVDLHEYLPSQHLFIFQKTKDDNEKDE